MKAFVPTIVITVVSTLSTIAPPSPGWAETKPPTDTQVSVVVVRATKECFTETIRVTGILVPRQEAVVPLNPGAKVAEVLVNEGDQVTSGQQLARLTPLPNDTPGAPSTTKTIVLKAPASGVITRSTARIRATASPLSNDPLFLIAVDNEIEIEAEVPSIHVPSLGQGQTARIAISADQELLGRVRMVPSIIDQTRQLGRARLSLERSPLLRFGMFVAATIDANRSCGVSVLSSAVQHRTEGTSIQVVRGEVIARTPVQVGLYSDTHTEIRSGLEEGEMVVANSGGSLQDGDRVKPILSDGAQTQRR